MEHHCDTKSTWSNIKPPEQRRDLWRASKNFAIKGACYRVKGPFRSDKALADRDCQKVFAAGQAAEERCGPSTSDVAIKRRVWKAMCDCAGKLKEAAKIAMAKRIEAQAHQDRQDREGVGDDDGASASEDSGVGSDGWKTFRDSAACAPTGCDSSEHCVLSGGNLHCSFHKTRK